MKHATLDLTHIETAKALQIYLQYMLDFPAWYGRNLDALSDMLGETARDTQYTLLLPAEPGSEMAQYLPRLLRVFADAARENAHVYVRVENGR